MNKINKKNLYKVNTFLLIIFFLATILSSCSKAQNAKNSSGNDNSNGAVNTQATPTANSSTSIPNSANTSTNTSDETCSLSKKSSSCSNIDTSATAVATATYSYNNPTHGNASSSSSNYCESRGLDLADHIWDDDYLRIPVVNHGSLVGGVMWTSWSTDRSEPIRIKGTSILEGNLVTDTSLAVRVYVKAAPRQCSLTGIPSTIIGKYNSYNPYTQLEVTIGIRNPESSSTNQWEKITFSKVKVNECSPVRYFLSVPNTSKPLIVEVLDVKSDFLCSQGVTGYCPTTNIAWLACFEIEVQVATDNTKRIPE
ncbi:MAG: hypothetical protein HQK51_04645 [Oligoflexia bacterium]|nr:hypothetical protein [Oligoflexia bacterium]